MSVINSKHVNWERRVDCLCVSMSLYVVFQSYARSTINIFVSMLFYVQYECLQECNETYATTGGSYNYLCGEIEPSLQHGSPSSVMK